MPLFDLIILPDLPLVWQLILSKQTKYYPKLNTGIRGSVDNLNTGIVGLGALRLAKI